MLRGARRISPKPEIGRATFEEATSAKRDLSGTPLVGFCKWTVRVLSSDRDGDD
jgi:hypothetical protein